MKKIVIGALVAGTVLAAAPAPAQILSGTINVSGTIAPKCQVVFPGPASPSFTSTVDLGDISQANGTLRPSNDLATLFNNGGGGSANLDFQIVCTTANPVVSIDADPIVSAATADTGYANRVDYLGVVDLDLIGPTTAQFTNDSTAGASSGGALAARLATGQTNLSITANTFRTAAATDVLVAGSYTGLITITVAPQ
jgi:hypothetical protein